MKIGYCRVSTTDQNLSLQKDALKNAGCEKIFEDVISGAKSKRPGLSEIIDYARKGDSIVVWRLDRLGRSLKDLITIVGELEKKGVELISIHEAINTKTSSGKLYFHMFAALAEFERNIISERTKAGLDAARARGRLGGRPKGLNKSKRKHAVDLYNAKDKSIKEICEIMSISKPTLYKYVEEFNEDLINSKL